MNVWGRLPSGIFLWGGYPKDTFTTHSGLRTLYSIIVTWWDPCYYIGYWLFWCRWGYAEVFSRRLDGIVFKVSNAPQGDGWPAQTCQACKQLLETLRPHREFLLKRDGKESQTCGCQLPWPAVFVGYKWNTEPFLVCWHACKHHWTFSTSSIIWSL